MDRVQTELPDQKMLWAEFGLASRLTKTHKTLHFGCEKMENNPGRQKDRGIFWRQRTSAAIPLNQFARPFPPQQLRPRGKSEHP